MATMNHENKIQNEIDKYETMQRMELQKRMKMYKDISVIKSWIVFWSILALLPFILGVILMIIAIIAYQDVYF